MPDLNIVLTDIAAEIEADAVRIEEAADAKEPGLKPGPFGIAVTMLNGERFCSGAAATPFKLKKRRESVCLGDRALRDR
ncbi:hypothetical protein [uncultured Sphingomonas sp.]|uniref:hypothetical protein n=1 Tax=uncultured Sphingomonas sp. TaxID=158754 RepID=UPI0025E7732F|nr:hypothetical protein [uncultured Sphingomonas sp.]